jgi:uncharacterized protein YjiS (DUF1127 family)
VRFSARTTLWGTRSFVRRMGGPRKGGQRYRKALERSSAGCQHAGAPTALGICQVVWPMRADEARIIRGAAAMQQVADWLEKLGLGQYAQRFVENDISFSVLPDLTDQDLKDIGVSLGHRRQLLREIAKLGQTAAAPESAPSVTARPPAPAGSPGQ